MRNVGIHELYHDARCLRWGFALTDPNSHSSIRNSSRPSRGGMRGSETRPRAEHAFAVVIQRERGRQGKSLHS